jgi:hypothetical protein
MLRGLRVENAAEPAPAEASAPTAEQTPYDATAGLIVIGILALVVILLVRSASRRKGE